MTGHYHMIVTLGGHGIDFHADYDTEKQAIEQCRELLALMRPDIKAMVREPSMDEDTYMGVYDDNCGPNEWLWVPKDDEVDA